MKFKDIKSVLRGFEGFKVKVTYLAPMSEQELIGSAYPYPYLHIDTCMKIERMDKGTVTIALVKCQGDATLTTETVNAMCQEDCDVVFTYEGNLVEIDLKQDVDVCYSEREVCFYFNALNKKEV